VFDVLRTILHLGRGTEAYPTKAGRPAVPGIGLPVLAAGRCDGSADCVAACPGQAIRLVDDYSPGRTWELDLANCVFCGLCARVCPNGAITLTNEFELAARARPDLIQRVAISARELTNVAAN
jgi:hydrogenase-4 component H